MHTKILVTDNRLRPGDLIEEGEKLIRKLEEKKFPISAAFWRYLDEEGLLRLVIVSPFVGQEGPLRTYGYVREAVDELGDAVHFGLSDISVMSPSWSQFQDLRRSIEGVGAGGFHPATHQWLGLGDIYLYRWNPDEETGHEAEC